MSSSRKPIPRSAIPIRIGMISLATLTVGAVGGCLVGYPIWRFFIGTSVSFLKVFFPAFIASSFAFLILFTVMQSQLKAREAELPAVNNATILVNDGNPSLKKGNKKKKHRKKR